MKYLIKNILIVLEVVLVILIFSSPLALSSEVDIQNLQKEMNTMKKKNGGFGERS